MATIKEVLETYKNAVFDTQIELQFWNRFLDHAIEQYFNAYPQQIGKTINRSAFSVYNFDLNTGAGTLKTQETIKEISADKLSEEKRLFFEWTMNLSLLKLYNALEILLLRSIQIKCFPNLKDPLSDRKEMNKVTEEIKTYLKNKSIKVDTNNNKHLIKFLEDISADFSNFIKLPVRIDRNTNWLGFFEMTSIFRNIIAHHNMLVTINSSNEIKTHAKDIFEQYFYLKKIAEGNILSPKQDLGSFSNFINLFNDFGINTVKFLFEEKDFQFLDLN